MYTKLSLPICPGRVYEGWTTFWIPATLFYHCDYGSLTALAIRFLGKAFRSVVFIFLPERWVWTWTVTSDIGIDFGVTHGVAPN